MSACLQRLGRATEPAAVLVLQPAAEAFFLVHTVTAEQAKEVIYLFFPELLLHFITMQVHAREEAARESGTSMTASLPPLEGDIGKLLHFAEKHRTVLNQVRINNNNNNR